MLDIYVPLIMQYCIIIHASMYLPHSGAIGLSKLLTGVRNLEHFLSSIMVISSAAYFSLHLFLRKIHHSFSFHSSTMFVTISASSQMHGRANSKQNVDRKTSTEIPLPVRLTFPYTYLKKSSVRYSVPLAAARFENKVLM